MNPHARRGASGKAGWMGLGVLGLASVAWAQSPVASMPHYPGANDVSLALGLEAGGESMQASYFTTADTLEEVLRFYAQIWEAAGYPVTIDGRALEGGIVSAYLPRESLQLAVVVRRVGARTLAFRVERTLPRDAPPVRPAGREAGSLRPASEVQ